MQIKLQPLQLQEFTLEFDMTDDTDEYAIFFINMGSSTGSADTDQHTITIDDIVLKKVP